MIIIIINGSKNVTVNDCTPATIKGPASVKFFDLKTGFLRVSGV